MVRNDVHLGQVARNGRPATAQALVDTAHQICPCSNAVRGNVDVKIARTFDWGPCAMDLPDKDPDPLSLDRQVCFLLYAASNLLNRLYRPVLAKLDLTYPQYLVLLVLWEDHPQTVGSLGARLYLDSGTLTPLLKRMEGADLVTRRRDPDDERRVIVELTDKGAALRDAARDIPKTLAASLDLGPDQVDDLRHQVRALVRTLGEKA